MTESGQQMTDAHNASSPPLPREELRDVIDLALWSGQLLLQYGAEARRVEETVHRLGTALGWLSIYAGVAWILLIVIALL